MNLEAESDAVINVTTAQSKKKEQRGGKGSNERGEITGTNYKERRVYCVPLRMSKLSKSIPSVGNPVNRE